MAVKQTAHTATPRGRPYAMFMLPGLAIRMHASTLAGDAQAQDRCLREGIGRLLAALNGPSTFEEHRRVEQSVRARTLFFSS